MLRLAVLASLAAAAFAVSALDLDPNCRSQGLCQAANIKQQVDSIPTDIFANVDLLNMADNLLTNFTGTELEQFPLLEEVRFDSNPLTNVHPDLFSTNFLLKRIFIQQTHDSDFPTRRPGIFSLHPDVFRNLVLLEEVHLDTSNMGALPAGLFRNNPNLKFVSLRHNVLSDWPDDLFDRIAASKFALDIRNNVFTTLTPRMLYGLSGATAATTVQVNDNQITALPAFIPLGVDFEGLHTNPGFTDVSCASNPRVNQLPITARLGEVQDFCAYDCTPCQFQTYATTECTADGDRECQLLPDACINGGQCSGLGLESIPVSLAADLSTLNVSGNLLFAIDVDSVLAAYPQLSLDQLTYSENPGEASTACNSGTVYNTSLNFCTHSCVAFDATFCTGGDLDFIVENCTSVTPAHCQTCRTAPCLPSDSWSHINCTLYTDKSCLACTLCTADEFISSDCAEYTDRTCAACAPPCLSSETETRACGGDTGFEDRVCEACHSTCLTCNGTSAAECATCQPGLQLLDVTNFGGPPDTLNCVPYEACQFSAWTPENFTQCSVECGGGTQFRTRSHTNFYPCFVVGDEASFESQACNTQLCTFPSLRVTIAVLNTTVSDYTPTIRVNMTTAFAEVVGFPEEDVFLVDVAQGEDTADNVTVTEITFRVVYMEGTDEAALVEDIEAALATPEFPDRLADLLGIPVFVEVAAIEIEDQEPPPPPPPGPFPVGLAAGGAVAALLLGFVACYACWYGRRSAAKKAAVRKEAQALAEVIAAKEGAAADAEAQARQEELEKLMAVRKPPPRSERTPRQRQKKKKPAKVAPAAPVSDDPFAMPSAGDVFADPAPKKNRTKRRGGSSSRGGTPPVPESV